MDKKKKFEDACHRFRDAERELRHAKMDILHLLGLQDMVRYGSLLKVDWNKIRHGLPPFPWIQDQLNALLYENED